MIKRNSSLFMITTVLIICIALQAQGQELGEHMEFMRPFIGKTWLGHYSNPEDAHYRHIVKWESILDGQSVRLTKSVDELSFAMETIYYWDAGKQQVAFLSLTNRGQLSRGAVKIEGDLVIMEGESIVQEGNRPFKTSYFLRPDGTLEDRFHVKSGDKWNQRHLILMTELKDKE
ncbi:MAG: hypothetical protein KOO63_15970 [Bacteroidales bacterium]|nr:hypothetical protein [Candidatus Latescibacterota bacterium]